MDLALVETWTTYWQKGYVNSQNRLQVTPALSRIFKKIVFPAGLEPATFRVWGGRDNHYATETNHK